MKKLLLLIVLTLTGLPALHADSLTFTLTAPSQFGHAGDTLSYDGTVTASTANGGALYLNGDSFNISGTAVLDDSPFLTNFPLFLNPGDTFTGTLFTVMLPSGLPGPYSGSFSILGGSDGNTYSTLGTQAFTAATPEPDSWLLLATGLVLTAIWSVSRSISFGAER